MRKNNSDSAFAPSPSDGVKKLDLWVETLMQTDSRPDHELSVKLAEFMNNTL